MVFEILSITSTVMLGLFAGSLLTEAMILVPYWRRMPEQDFFRLHHTLGPKLFTYFAPITTIAVLLSVLIAVLDGFDNPAWSASAVLSAMALAIFFIYFRAANMSFATQSLKSSELENELRRWSNWHWLRTSMIILAFTASILGHIA